MFDNFARVKKLDSRKKLLCNECGRSTIHQLEAQCLGTWEDEHSHGTVDGGTAFSLYRCGACDNVCFETDKWFSEDVDYDENGNTYNVHTYQQFPPPSSSHFTFDTSFVPPRLAELIDEMMYCLAGGKLSLSTMGLRLVIEFIVNDNECSGSNLVEKINEFCDKYDIDKDQRDLLHKIRIRGNKSAHEGISMSTNEMVAGMGVISQFLERLYNGPARQQDAVEKAKKAFREEKPSIFED